jgi:hypothetical protein
MHPLASMLATFRYKEGWRFALREGYTLGSMTADTLDQVTGNAGGTVISTYPLAPLWLLITIRTPDSTDPGKIIDVTHTFPVPIYDHGDAWRRRWLLDRVLDVERHEACEFFELDGKHPFYPEHGPDVFLYGIRDRTAV